jgi:hypothetical protein
MATLTMYDEGNRKFCEAEMTTVEDAIELGRVVCYCPPGTKRSWFTIDAHIAGNTRHVVRIAGPQRLHYLRRTNWVSRKSSSKPWYDPVRPAQEHRLVGGGLEEWVQRRMSGAAHEQPKAAGRPKRVPLSLYRYDVLFLTAQVATIKDAVKLGQRVCRRGHWFIIDERSEQPIVGAPKLVVRVTPIKDPSLPTSGLPREARQWIKAWVARHSGSRE